MRNKMFVALGLVSAGFVASCGGSSNTNTSINYQVISNTAGQPAFVELENGLLAVIDKTVIEGVFEPPQLGDYTGPELEGNGGNNDNSEGFITQLNNVIVNGTTIPSFVYKNKINDDIILLIDTPSDGFYSLALHAEPYNRIAGWHSYSGYAIAVNASEGEQYTPMPVEAQFRFDSGTFSLGIGSVDHGLIINSNDGNFDVSTGIFSNVATGSMYYGNPTVTNNGNVQVEGQLTGAQANGLVGVFAWLPDGATDLGFEKGEDVLGSFSAVRKTPLE